MSGTKPSGYFYQGEVVESYESSGGIGFTKIESQVRRLVIPPMEGFDKPLCIVLRGGSWENGNFTGSHTQGRLEIETFLRERMIDCKTIKKVNVEGSVVQEAWEIFRLTLNLQNRTHSMVKLMTA
ncbi:MAG: hypothetical protein AAB597_01160 [Patescibacteria group bacterium]